MSSLLCLLLVLLLEHRRLNPGAFGYRAAKVERTVGGQSKRKGKGKGKRGADEMGEELAKLFKRQRTATTGADDTEDDIFEGPLPELTDSEEEEEEIDDDGQESVERDIDPMLEREEALDDVGADGTWETGPLTLVRDSNRAKCPTRLCKSNEGHAWTVLKPPRSAVRLAGSDAMVAAIVFREKADRERKTLRFVKENSRLYTVGPMDFCGHAKAAKVGQGWLIAPCHWHSSLTNPQQLRAYQMWQTIGTWKRGMQKLSKKAMRTRINLQTRIRKELKLRWNIPRPMTERDVVLEVRRQTAIKLAKQRARNLKMAKASGLRAAKKTSKNSASHLSDVFHSQRLNDLGGDVEGRMKLKSLATMLLGVRRRARRRE
ncbi:hypothetical protein C8R47DRAFT_1298977 [Mycena vitilis]|nr:hypothetical protein C8R47DRAFT_1298977 [Mycena vitilis]